MTGWTIGSVAYSGASGPGLSSSAVESLATDAFERPGMSFFVASQQQ